MRTPAYHSPAPLAGHFAARVFGDQSPHPTEIIDPHDRMENESWFGKGALKFRAGLITSDSQATDALDFVCSNYRQAGYSTPDSLAPAGSECVTAAAKRHQKMIGTLTLWRDGPSGLQADEIYGEELDRLRRRGDRLGELGRLAMDSRTPAITLLLSMVGKVAAAGCDRWHVTDFIVECNPRHVGFYTRMLGFSVVGGKRDCSLVGAPAVLLHVSAHHLLNVTHQFGHVARIKCLRSEVSRGNVVEQSMHAESIMSRGTDGTAESRPGLSAGAFYGDLVSSV